MCGNAQIQNSNFIDKVAVDYDKVFSNWFLFREYFIVIDRDFIYEIGVLYLTIAAQAMIASLKNRFQEE